MFAQYLAVSSLSVARKPPSLSHVEAAGVPLAALTAWGMVVEVAKAREHDRIGKQPAAARGKYEDLADSCREHATRGELLHGAVGVSDFYAHSGGQTLLDPSD